MLRVYYVHTASVLKFPLPNKNGHGELQHPLLGLRRAPSAAPQPSWPLAVLFRQRSRSVSSRHTFSPMDLFADATSTSPC